MRVYLPLTLPALTTALKTGEVGPAPIMGFAVTPTLREGYASGDLDELEYVALTEAARAAKDKTTVKVTIIRDGKTQEVDVKVPRRLRTADL